MEDSFEEMDQLLHAWNLSQLSQIFREQEINVDTLEALTDADIVELIPKVGPRALFRKRLNEWLNNPPEYISVEVEEKDENTVLEQNETQYFDLETLEEEIERNDAKSEMYLQRTELAICNEVEIENKISNANQNQEGMKQTQSTTNETEVYLGIDYLEDVLVEQELATKRVNKLNCKDKNAMKQRKQDFRNAKKDNATQKIYVIKNETIKEATAGKAMETDTIRYLNVEELLLSTEEGRMIIENYEAEPHIDKKTRLFIADVLISEVFAKNFVLDRAKFQDIASQIVELFPNEDIKTWFVPQCGNSRNSGGTLFYKYYTVNRKMRKTGFYEHYIHGVIKHFDNDVVETDNNHCAINPEEIDDEPDKLALKRAIPKYERLRRSCDFERIHVKNLLESSHEGRGIMEIYNKHETFDLQTRNRLCKLIVLEATRRNIKMRPRDFYDISCQIVDLFPSQTIDIYFLPRGRTPPKGCLYHKYRDIQRGRCKLRTDKVNKLK